MRKTILVLILITILSKFLGLSREIVLAYYYGASGISDAYLIAQTIPMVIFAFLGQAISTGYIPIYNKTLVEHGEKKANLFTSNLINILLIVSLVVILIGQLFPYQIVSIFASGFEGETLEIAVNFTRISLFSLAALSVLNVLLAFLRIKESYIITSLIGFPLNIVLLLSVVLSYEIDILFLGLGIPLSILAQLIFLLPFVFKKNINFEPYLDFKEDNIKLMVSLAMPIIIGVAINDVNKIVDRTIASQVAIGGIAILNYANKIKWLVLGIASTSITTVLYPVISRMVSERNVTLLKKVLAEAIIGTNLLIIPATVALIVLAEPITEFLFGRGAFSDNEILLTSEVLIFYSIGMVGVSLREVLARPFYANQDMKTPMINSSIGMIINIILNILLSRWFGVRGIALATSFAAIVSSILMAISLRKKIGPFGMKQISLSFLKILSASVLMGVLAKLVFNYSKTSLSQNISLLFTIMVGAAFYFVIIYFMKIEDVNVIVDSIKKKFKNRNSKAN